MAKTKALICVFVLAYAKSRFSHDVAHITTFSYIHKRTVIMGFSREMCNYFILSLIFFPPVSFLAVLFYSGFLCVSRLPGLFCHACTILSGLQSQDRMVESTFSRQNEPRREKTSLPGLTPGLTQTRLCNHRKWLEALNFRFSK